MDATPTLNTIPLNPGEFETLAHALDYASEGQTGFNFYSRKGELYAALPYSRIRSDARKLARRLLGLGLGRGARVAIIAVTHPDFVRFFFACQYAGLIPVPLPAGTHLNGADAYTAQLRRLISICGAKIAVSTEELLPYLISASEGQNLIMAALPENFDSLPESSEVLYPLASHEIAYLQFTLKPSDIEGIDLSNWRIAGIGAEMIRMESLEKFARCLRPAGFDERAFIPCYGMAECSLAVTFAQIGEGVKTDTIDAERLSETNEVVHVSGHQANRADTGRKTTFVRCGRPLPSFDVEIRDEQGNLVPEGMCGALFLKGPSIMSGYFGDSNATKEVLSEDGWLNTGDIAYWSDGEIVITGRSKDLIIINGRNIWPQDIEYLAETLDGVRAGDACAFSCRDDNGREQAVLLVQSRTTDIAEKNRLAEQLKRLVLQELGIDCTVELVPKNTLVRTTSGKPSRSGTRKVYLNMLAQNQAAA